MPASKRSNNQEKARNFQNFESEVRWMVEYLILHHSATE
jgi:hypothetical protein